MKCVFTRCQIHIYNNATNQSNSKEILKHIRIIILFKKKKKQTKTLHHSLKAKEAQNSRAKLKLSPSTFSHKQ